MDTHVFDLTVVDVVEETADAHSVCFAVPEGAEAEFDYTPGQFLTLAVPSDQTGVAARCYSLSSSPHDGGPLTVTVKRTVDGYASNWICDNLREGDTIKVLPPSGIFTPGLAGRGPAAVRRRQRHHAGHVDHPHRARARQRPDRAVLRQPRRDVGDLRQGARRARRGAPGPARRRPLAGVGPGPAHPGADEVVHRAVHDLRRVRLRPRAVHEADDRGAARAGLPAGAPPPGEVHLAGRQPVRRRDRGREGRARARGGRLRRGFTEGAPEPSRSRGPRGRSTSRSSSTARPTSTTTGSPGPSCSSTWSQGREGAVLLPRGRVLGLRRPAARGRGQDACTTTSSTTRTSPRGSGWAASRCR